MTSSSALRAMRSHRWRQLLTAAVVMTAADDASILHAQDTIRIHDEPACSTCTIVFDTVAILNDNDTATLSWRSAVAAVRDRFFVAPLYTRGEIAMYDRRGTFMGMIGRSGSGPGEFSNPIHTLAIGPGDSLHVISPDQWTVFAPPDYEFVRSIRLPALPASVAIVGSGRNRGDMIAALPRQTDTGQFFTVHLFSAATGDVIRSYDAPEPAELQLSIGSHRSVTWYDDRIWSLARDRISLRSWHLNGDSALHWLRSDGWFAEPTVPGQFEPFFDRPTPKAWSVHITPETIWVFLHRADADWEPIGISRSDPELYRKTLGLDMNTLYDGMIEVFDHTGKVFDTLISPEVLAPASGREFLVYRKKMKATGEISIQILRPRLRDGGDGWPVRVLWG